MDITSANEIQAIKVKIKEVKEGIVKRNSLQRKREELENILLETQVKAQHSLLKAYQKKQHDEIFAEKYYNQADEYEKISQELLRKLTLVDKEIDKWEEIEEEEILQLQDSLIQIILKNHPDQNKVFDLLKENGRKNKIINEDIEKLIAFLANVEHLITTIEIMRKRIKKQGVFSYIFGSSPNLMIAQCLQGIQIIVKEEQKTIAAIKNHLADSPLSPTLNELMSYTENLSEDCEKRWNYRHLDSLIEKNFLKAQEFKEKLESYQLTIIDEINKNNEELENWLEKF